MYEAGLKEHHPFFSRRRILIAAGALLALGLVAGPLLGLMMPGGIAGDGPVAETPLQSVASPDPATLAATVGHTVFWMRRSGNTRLDIETDRYGNVRLAYRDPGSDDTSYVSTYPFEGAYRLIRSVAAEAGVEPVRSGSGIGFFDPARPSRIVIAWPDHPNLQVEVYDPDPRRALNLVRSGAVVPLR